MRRIANSKQFYVQTGVDVIRERKFTWPDYLMRLLSPVFLESEYGFYKLILGLAAGAMTAQMMVCPLDSISNKKYFPTKRVFIHRYCHRTDL